MRLSDGVSNGRRGGNSEESSYLPFMLGEGFSHEEGRLDSKWGLTSRQVILLICENCKFSLHFYEGNSIWDFD